MGYEVCLGERIAQGFIGFTPAKPRSSLDFYGIPLENEFPIESVLEKSLKRFTIKKIEDCNPQIHLAQKVNQIAINIFRSQNN